jgi:hypothetical protein
MSLWIHLKVMKFQNFRYKKSFIEDINVTNESLSAAGLPMYQYPFDLDITNLELPEIDGSRNELCHIQHISIMLSENSNWIPSSEFNQFSSNKIPDDLIGKTRIENRSHLAWNNYGKYIPVDFGRTSLSSEFLTMIGSSVNLKNEMESLASKLKLNLGEYTSDIDSRIHSIIDELEDDPLFVSKIMLIRFYNIVLASIKYNLIICMD